MGDKKYKQSKAEIAKQFNLPERQSKITTLLNQAGQAYCICRSSDSSRFMIACDSCEEWYHGDCINISEREAKYIKNYFCDRCREEDPTLKTRFRPQKRENDGDVVSIDDWQGPLNIAAVYSPPRHRVDEQMFSDFLNTLGGRYVAGGDWNAKNILWGSRLTTTRGRELKKAIDSDSLNILTTGEPSHWPSDPNKTPDLIDFFVTKGMSGLYTKVESCLDGNSDHTPVICTLSTTIICTEPRETLYNHRTDWASFQNFIEDNTNLRIPLKTEEDIENAAWYTTNLIQKAAWMSTPCIKHSLILSINVLAPRDDRKKKRKEKDHSENKSSKRPSTKDGCGDCPGCLQMNDCGHCDACEDMYKYSNSNKLKLKCKMRLCIKSTKKPSRQSSSSNRIKKKHHEREQHEPEESITHLQTTEARQCYGPQCTRPAQYSSKYCSAQCGMRLATARIYQVLPQRIQEWSLSTCVAEQKNRKALEVVRGGLARAQAALRALDTQHSDLDAIVARAKNATIVHTDDKDADDETSMYCITCGHEIHSRTAVKHMEKCFVKYEAQASFGSRHRTRIDGQSMFCDYYNPINATYCKRLRVMCPEHFKDPKVGDHDVCGCPLVRNVFKPTGEFCRAPKKACLKHYQWEKLRRAEIDMERVRQWLKLDELVEQERSIRLAMASRAGVLGLMLHSTYNHEVMERITTKATENGKVTAKEGS